MKVLVAISAPAYGHPTGARGAQYEFTNMAAVGDLVMSRVRMMNTEGHFEHNGISASWRIELEPVAKPADDEAA